MPKFLIVNADDLGISQASNLAIGQGFREGILTSASLMANMPAFGHAIEKVVRRHAELGVGVHLCLTSGRPLSNPARVPLLVDRKGRFRHGFFGLWRLLRSPCGPAALAQVRLELQAQVERVEAEGILIDHVNSHQHVHLLPGVAGCVAEIARGRGVAVRVPAGKGVGSLFPRRPGHSAGCVTTKTPDPFSAHTWHRRLARLAGGGVAKEAVLAFLTARAAEDLSGVRTTGVCWGVAESGRMTLPVLMEIVASLTDGVHEVFTHPALAGCGEELLECSRADRQFLRSPYRGRELAALLDPGLHDCLRQREISAIVSSRLSVVSQEPRS